jgi:iron complex transport system substrate-binding protein
MKKFLSLLLTLAMLLSFTACGSKPAETAPATEATQAAAQATEPVVETTEPAPAEPVVNKCVIYISSLGTILDAFDKSDCIVGAYGSLAEGYGVPSCGKWNEVDVEAVIATGADAVFGYKNYTTEEQIAILEQAGITCYFIELSNADTAAEEVAELGRLFGCQEKAQVFVDLYNQYDALLKDKLASVTSLNVYVEGTSSTPKTANGTSAAHKLVVGAGLVNLYANNETQYPERNLEDVITKNPDIIVKLLGSSATLDDATYGEYQTGLAGVAAADNGKIILLNNECGTTAIGAVIGRLYVAKFAYPELFADVDVDAVYEKLCTEFFGKEYTGSGAYFK